MLSVDGTPIMRTWNIVYLLPKTLSPAAEAFRYFVLERAGQMLKDHDAPLLHAEIESSA